MANINAHILHAVREQEKQNMQAYPHISLQFHLELTDDETDKTGVMKMQSIVKKLYNAHFPLPMAHEQLVFSFDKDSTTPVNGKRTKHYELALQMPFANNQVQCAQFVKELDLALKYASIWLTKSTLGFGEERKPTQNMRKDNRIARPKTSQVQSTRTAQPRKSTANA